MSEKKFNVKEFVYRILEAIAKRVEGTKDIKKKLDYLGDPSSIECLADLEPAQLDAVAGMIQIGNMYKTLELMRNFGYLYARWSPSNKGKRAELLARVMMQVAPEQPQQQTTINTGTPILKGGGSDKDK